MRAHLAATLGLFVASVAGAANETIAEDEGATPGRAASVAGDGARLSAAATPAERSAERLDRALRRLDRAAAGPPALPPPGAASCTGCHADAAGAAVTSPGPRLAGVRREELLSALAGFRSGERPATVMDRIVRGFSDDELRRIAEWFAGQR